MPPDHSSSGTTRATVLVVDDLPENLDLLGQMLRPRYRVRVANSGRSALRAAASEPVPDLILLDVMMPDMDGYEVMRRLAASAETRNIPVIFLTAMSADLDEETGLSLGAVDYITKPIRPGIVLRRICTHLELKAARDRLSDDNRWLEQEVGHRVRENELVKEVSLHALALLAEARDHETGNHLHRTRAYVLALARQLARQPRYAAELTERQCWMMARAAPLHDIGKVGIPDEILHKPGRLTPAEYEVMKTHAAIGGQAIEAAVQRVRDDPAFADLGVHVKGSLAFLELAQQIAAAHHERWDGGGYPLGLSGEAIPLAARLMSLADVFDALSCRRVYKPRFDPATVDEMILAGRGSQFDPDVVTAYVEVRAEFLEVSQRYADSQS